MNFIVHPITNEKHGLNTKAAKDLIHSYVLNYQNGGSGTDGGGGVKPTKQGTSLMDTSVFIYGKGHGAGFTDPIYFLPPACMPYLQIYSREYKLIYDKRQEIRAEIETLQEKIKSEEKRFLPIKNTEWWNVGGLLWDFPPTKQDVISARKNIDSLNKEIYYKRRYLGDFSNLTPNEIQDCSKFKIPIIGENIDVGGGTFGSIFTVLRFPRQKEFKIAQGTGTYLMKVLESVPVGIKEEYMKPRTHVIKKGEEEEELEAELEEEELEEYELTLTGFEAAVRADSITDPVAFVKTPALVKTRYQESIEILRNHMQEIQTMKKLADKELAANIASVWYSSSEHYHPREGHRTTLMYILEKGIPVDKYIEKEPNPTKLITLSARITILLERLYDEPRLINIDIKPPNMIVKDSQQLSADVHDSVRSRIRRRTDTDPKPLFIDCGDPNYVLEVKDIKENYYKKFRASIAPSDIKEMFRKQIHQCYDTANSLKDHERCEKIYNQKLETWAASQINREKDDDVDRHSSYNFYTNVTDEDLRICLIFLQQLIFYEYMLGSTRMEEVAEAEAVGAVGAVAAEAEAVGAVAAEDDIGKAKYFIPSYTQHFVNVEKTYKGLATVKRRTALLKMILNLDDYNFTLKHYSLKDNPWDMFVHCWKKYAKEKSLQLIIKTIIEQENIER